MTARHARTHGWLARVFVLLSGSIGSAIFSFVTQLLCARSMPVADYGRLVALLAAVNILAVFSGYGVGWYWLQLFGREGRNAYRWIRRTIQLLALACLTGAVLLTIYVLWGDYDDPWLSIALLIPILFSQSLAETTTSRFQLEERFAVLGFWQSAMQSGRFIVSLILIGLSMVDFRHLLAGYAAVSVLMTGVSLVSLDQVRRQRIKLVGHRSTQPVGLPEPISVWAVLVGSTPYCFCTIFYIVCTSGVVAIVERMLGGEQAALYNSAYLIIAAIYLVPSVVYMKYLVGKIFRWSAHDPDLFSAVIHLGVGLGFVAGILCMIVVIASAGFVLPLLFGARFSGAVPILIVLAIGIPVRFVQHAYGAAFFSEENMKRKVWCLGGAAGICLLLSGILIPLLGIEGAAVASVGSELGLLGFFMAGVDRYVGALDLRSTLSIRGLRAACARIGQYSGLELGESPAFLNHSAILVSSGNPSSARERQ
jgi:O-antigen/teichoic acid export membrane protein